MVWLLKGICRYLHSSPGLGEPNVQRVLRGQDLTFDIVAIKRRNYKSRDMYCRTSAGESDLTTAAIMIR